MTRALRLLLGKYAAQPTSCCPSTRGITAGILLSRSDSGMKVDLP
jgi:hypothetical protein